MKLSRTLLVTLLDNELMQLIEKIKREKGGEGLTFSHEDGHVPKVKGFNRRNLGRKLTEEEQNQRDFRMNFFRPLLHEVVGFFKETIFNNFR